MMENLSEFIGIMLGNGYFDDIRIKITFNSNDLDYIHYVKNLINKLFNTYPILKFRKNENTADLFIFKRDIIKELKNKGLILSPKWNRAIIPQSYLKHDLKVLRGYFDTDGSLVTTKNNGTMYPRLEMKISPSPMQSQFIDILNKYNFRFGVYNIGKGKVRIQINGKIQLKKWCNIVGFSNFKHLSKAKLFVEI